MPIDRDRWYTLSEAAELLGVNNATVRGWARAGGLAVAQVGGTVKVCGAALLDRRRTSRYVLQANAPTAQPQPPDLPYRKSARRRRKGYQMPKGEK